MKNETPKVLEENTGEFFCNLVIEKASLTVPKNSESIKEEKFSDILKNKILSMQNSYKRSQREK